MWSWRHFVLLAITIVASVVASLALVESVVGGTSIQPSPPFGPAGGDLAGAYPNPVLSATGIAAGNYQRVQMDTKGRALAGTRLAVGAPIASAGTITLTAPVHHITGIGAIQTINLPADLIAGESVVLFPDGLFTTIIGGNIARASVAVLDRALILTWDGALLYPSY